MHCTLLSNVEIELGQGKHPIHELLKLSVHVISGTCEIPNKAMNQWVYNKVLSRKAIGSCSNCGATAVLI